MLNLKLNNMEEIIRFAKTPEPGNKVKVYLLGNKQVYGIVIKVIESKIRKREMIILEASKEVFPLGDCDYCLDSNLVIIK